MEYVIEERVEAVEDVEVLAQATAESPDFADDLAETLAWLREHGYRIVR
jgi:phosphoserine phosphatase